MATEYIITTEGTEWALARCYDTQSTAVCALALRELKKPMKVRIIPQNTSPKAGRRWPYTDMGLGEQLVVTENMTEDDVITRVARMMV